MAYKRSVPLEDKHRWVARAAAILQEEVEEPQRYRMLQQIATEPVKQRLLDWDPDCPQPQMGPVDLHVQREMQGLSIVVTVFVDFDAVKDRYYGVVQLRPNWRAVENADQLIQFYRDSLPEMVKSSAESLAQGLTPEKILDPKKRYWTTSAIQKLAQRTLEEDAQLQRQIQEIQTAWRDAYRVRIGKARSLPGFAPAQIVSLEARCEIEYEDRSNCRVSLRALLDGGLYWQGEAAFPVGRCPFYTTVKAKKAYLQQAIRSCMATLLTPEVPVPLVCIAPSLDALPGMPPGLSTLLRTGESSLGNVTVSWKRRGYSTDLVFWRPEKDRGKIRYCKEPGNSSNLEECYVIPLRVENLQETAVPLEQFQRLPGDLLGWWNLALAFQKALQEALEKRNRRLPDVDVASGIAVTIAVDSTHPAVSYGPVYDWKVEEVCKLYAPKQQYAGEVLQTALQRLIKDICRAVNRQESLGVQQLQVLNDLSAAELSVLRHLAKYPDSRVETMARALRKDPDDVDQILWELLHVQVPVGDGDAPVISKTETYDSGDWHTVFSLNRINPDLMKIAVGSGEAEV